MLYVVRVLQLIEGHIYVAIRFDWFIKITEIILNISFLYGNISSKFEV